jgi:hypothetical protein
MHMIRRVVYSPLIALEQIPAFRNWFAPFLADVIADRYALFERSQGLHGGSIESAISFLRTHGHRRFEDCRLLILGCGQGREIDRWMKERVGYIVGQEYLDFSSDWKGLSGTNQAVVRSNIEALPFPECTFDLVFAKAVFEHLGSFETCIREIHRTMRAGALIWADFGPLWYTYGGPHDDNIGYEQVVLSDAELSTRFRPGGEGDLYWRNGMFSRLRVGEYRSVLERYFEIRHWGIGISTRGLRFKKANPDRWRELCRKESEADLLVWAVYFLGQKR